MKKKNKLTSNSGMLTVDFLFSFVIVFSFLLILLSLSFTLTVAEITQYITYSSARSFFAAHKTPEEQKSLALSKYTELTEENPGIKKLFTNGWFIIGGIEGEKGSPIQLGSNSDQPIQIISNSSISYSQGGNYKETPPPDNNDQRAFFIGAWLSFRAKILEINIPLLGNSSPQSKGYTTTIGSYLGREPTSEECVSFGSKRWSNLMEKGNYKSVQSEEPFNLIDDGC